MFGNFFPVLKLFFYYYRSFSTHILIFLNNFFLKEIIISPQRRIQFFFHVEVLFSVMHSRIHFSPFSLIISQCPSSSSSDTARRRQARKREITSDISQAVDPSGEDFLHCPQDKWPAGRGRRSQVRRGGNIVSSVQAILYTIKRKGRQISRALSNVKSEHPAAGYEEKSSPFATKSAFVRKIGKHQPYSCVLSRIFGEFSL